MSRVVLGAVRRAVAAEELRGAVPDSVVVRRPPRPGCGDYATNVALQIAGSAGRTPYAVAEILARRLEKEPGIAQVEIAGRGFLNITLSAGAYGDVVRQVRAQREQYGRGDGLADEAVVVVAAEPGSLRGEIAAEVVNRLLEAAGAQPAAPGTRTEALSVQEPADPADPADPGGPAGPADPADPGTPNTPAAPLGPDATRWALLRPPAQDIPRLTTDLLDQRESNPLFRVRYARARALALVRNAHDLGVAIDTPVDTPADTAIDTAGETGAEDAEGPHESAQAAEGATDREPDRATYHHPAETELLGLVADFPRVVETAARRRAPDRVARHLERLADAFFRFHDECPPLPKGDEKPSAAHGARIRLTDATGVVLTGGLDLLGISAPDHM
nr:DALR anticodon-binding domain-containing protein [Streptomyces sp. SID4948]